MNLFLNRRYSVPTLRKNFKSSRAPHAKHCPERLLRLGLWTRVMPVADGIGFRGDCGLAHHSLFPRWRLLHGLHLLLPTVGAEAGVSLQSQSLRTGIPIGSRVSLPRSVGRCQAHLQASRAAISTTPIYFGGDSAGGGLAMATLTELARWWRATSAGSFYPFPPRRPDLRGRLDED